MVPQEPDQFRMPSFERSHPLNRALVILVLGAALVSSACMLRRPKPAPPVAAAVPETCTVLAGTSPEDTEALTALRMRAESAPLYAAIARAAVTSCRAGSDNGRLSVEYGFADGGTFRYTSTPRADAVDQDARFATPVADDAVEIMKRVERAAVSSGCGVNWEAPTADDTITANGEMIYRGTTCGCEARVGRELHGQVVRLVFRNSC